jgi:hypothetical protein
MAAGIALLLALGTTWFLLREPADIRLATEESAETVESLNNGQGTLRPVERPGPAAEGEARADLKVERGSTERLPVKTGGGLADATVPSGSAGSGTDAGADEKPLAQSRISSDPLLPVSSRTAIPVHADRELPGVQLTMTRPRVSPAEADDGIDVFEEWGEDPASRYHKWGVGTQVSPIYSYRNLEASGANAANASYFNEVEEGLVSFAGGVNVHYAPLKRLSVQSGLYYSSLGMKVGNAFYTVEEGNIFWDEAPSIQASINNSTGTIETQQGMDYTYKANVQPQPGTELTGAHSRANAPDAPAGEILQQFEYIELPLILRYRVIDRRLGFHFLGGFSSNFMVGNSAYYQESGNKERIGTTDNLRPVNYSSVVGLGIDYSISKRFHVNLEPTLRYYLNSINTGSIIKSYPYSIGFFTGLLYTF